MKTTTLTKKIITLSLLSLSIVHAQAQGIISTIAGNGIAGFHGDGGMADTCEVYNPIDLCLDTAGNIYISDVNNFRVRKIAKATGIITTIAGNGIDTFSADGVAASTTGMNPDGIFADAAGNVFIADVRNNRVRKVDAITGIISTIAGNGMQGYSGDTGLAVNEKLYWPTDVCTDTAGNIYIAEYGGNRIRKVTATTGKISTIAGNGIAGFSGDGAIATSAQLNAPGYVCVDKQGNIYISDVNNNIIRKVDATTGNINTVAGNDTGGFSGDGDLAINAKLLSPAGIFVNDNGDLYIADQNNNRIRKVSGGYIKTVAGGGTGTAIGDGNLSTNALLSNPGGVYVDTSGAMYIADMAHQRIRYVTKPVAINDPVQPLQFIIYPDPSKGKFMIAFSGATNAAGKIQLQVYDLSGTTIYRSFINAQKSLIDLTAYPNGLYFVQIRDQYHAAVKKILISR